jgi:coenzyme Q-binding protein COQ10
MAGAKKSVVMKVSLDALWQAVTDYEGYSDFVDGCAKCKVLKRKGNTVTVEYTINKFKQFSYILEHTETPKTSVKWRMLEGEFFKSNQGSWDIKDMGKKGLAVDYELEVGFPLLVPKSIVNGLVSTSLPEMLEGFEKRALGIEKKAAKKTKPVAKK